MRTSKTAGGPRRRAVNLTVREDFLETAKSLNINVSQAAEEGLRREVERRISELWLKENARALDAHNARVEKQGTLLIPDWADE